MDLLLLKYFVLTLDLQQNIYKYFYVYIYIYVPFSSYLYSYRSFSSISAHSYILPPCCVSLSLGHPVRYK